MTGDSGFQTEFVDDDWPYGDPGAVRRAKPAQRATGRAGYLANRESVSARVQRQNGFPFALRCTWLCAQSLHSPAGRGSIEWGSAGGPEVWRDMGTVYNRSDGATRADSRSFRTRARTR